MGITLLQVFINHLEDSKNYKSAQEEEVEEILGRSGINTEIRETIN